MVLVHPKKGIYKDGHERSDTVAYHKLYIAELNTFKSREQRYTGDQLEIPVTHDDTVYAKLFNEQTDTWICTQWKKMLSLFPFANEFMIKCWRRHRDVPTRIDQLVDRAVKDLLYRKHALRDRMTKNKIDGQSLVKVENLLLSCFEATLHLPDDSHGDVQKFKEKIKNITEKQATQETKFENTQLRFVAFHKKGRLGAACKPNWE
jgi:hypothetical protein